MSSAVCSTRVGGGVVLSALLLGSTLLASDHLPERISEVRAEIYGFSR